MYSVKTIVNAKTKSLYSRAMKKKIVLMRRSLFRK